MSRSVYIMDTCKSVYMNGYFKYFGQFTWMYDENVPVNWKNGYCKTVYMNG